MTSGCYPKLISTRFGIKFQTRTLTRSICLLNKLFNLCCLTTVTGIENILEYVSTRDFTASLKYIKDWRAIVARLNNISGLEARIKLLRRSSGFLKPWTQNVCYRSFFTGAATAETARIINEVLVTSGSWWSDLLIRVFGPKSFSHLLAPDNLG